MGMESTKAIIIGCSLGGAALVFIVVLILVCLCSRRNSRDGSIKKNGKAVEEDSNTNYSIQRSGLPPIQQSAFIRTGSQQWKGNISLISTPPTQPYSINIDKQQGNLHTNVVNYPSPQHVPWYQRTLGRARQFLLHRPIAYQSKRDSGEHLVDGRYSGNSIEKFNAATSAYVLNRKSEVPRIGEATAASRMNPSGNGYFNYGSQIGLIPNDVMASSVERRSATKEGDIQAYIAEQSRSVERRAVSQTTGTVFPRSSNPQALQAQYVNPLNFPRPRPTEARVFAQPGGGRENSNDSRDEASTQLSLPRPTVITREERLSNPAVSRDRVSSIMPPNGKHPTRPDTPTFDPQRKNGAPVNRYPHKDNIAMSQQHFKNKSTPEVQPTSPNPASTTSEEKKIGDAFKFLDDLEE